MKKKKIISKSGFSILVLFIAFVCARIYYSHTPCTYHDGDVSTWQNTLPDNKAYELALDNEGIPVFKRPFAALKQSKSDFKDCISILKSSGDYSFGLHVLNAHDYYGDSKMAVLDGVGMEQCTEETKDRMEVLRSILEYYQHSFRQR